MTTTLIKSKLTPEEAARLEELEPMIELGIGNFVEVGMALVEISDRRLYRQTHSSFESYCQERWSMSARHAYRLCEAAEAVKSLPAKCDQLVTVESQARELSKAAPEQREAVLQEAASEGPVTANAIKKAVQRRKSPAPEPEETPETPHVVIHDPAEALGSLKAARVIKTFRTWFTMNYHNRDEWNWALELIAEEVKNLKAQANS